MLVKIQNSERYLNLTADNLDQIGVMVNKPGCMTDEPLSIPKNKCDYEDGIVFADLEKNRTVILGRYKYDRASRIAKALVKYFCEWQEGMNRYYEMPEK